MVTNQTLNKVLKLLKVALIGIPNVGKSTLLNRLVYNDISCVSNKVHTTRKNILGVYTQDDTQLLFYDSPGIVTKEHIFRHRLEHSIVTEPETASHNCDLIGVVVDSSNQREQKSLPNVIKTILEEHRNKESILILNKVDILKEKRVLLDITARIADNNFSQVFSVSALNNDGIDQVRDYMLSRAKPIARWPYGPDFLTNQNTKEIVHGIIRGKVMDYLNQALPYVLQYKYECCKFDDMGSLLVHLTIKCPERFMVSKVIGEKGIIIFKIIEDSKNIISKTLGCDVKLNILVEADEKHTMNRNKTKTASR